jgi:predicted transcriptional regulator
MVEHGLNIQGEGVRLGPVLEAILHELWEERGEWVPVKRLQEVAAEVDLEEPLSERTVTNLINDLQKFGMITAAFKRSVRTTALGWAWLGRWYEDGSYDLQ